MKMLSKRPAGAVAMTLVAVLMAGVAQMGSASAATPHPVDPHEIQPQDVGVLLNSLPCVNGGPTAADGAMAATLNPLLGAKMRGEMNAYRVSCARAVVQAVKAHGYNQRAAAIAIATVIVESSIMNVDGGDLDSVGLYQQRSEGWGSFAERTNPVHATNMFLDVMAHFYPNGSWNTAPIGDVAADVQRPAAQYRYRYALEAGDATIIARKLWNAQPRYENLGVYRASTSTFILRKADGSVLTQVPFGDSSKGDVPVVGHFEDSRYDNLGVYRKSTGQFIIRKSDGSVLTTVAFGDTAKGDVPVVGHFENTEYDNLAVYRKSTGQFFIRKSDGSLLTTVAFGDTAKGDVPIVGHFENTEYDNLGVYRMSTGQFIIRKSDGSVLTTVAFGDTAKGDVPVVGHFENTEYDNLAVYRKSTGQFIIRKSDGSILTKVAFGDTAKGDIPVTGYFE